MLRCKADIQRDMVVAKIIKIGSEYRLNNIWEAPSIVKSVSNWKVLFWFKGAGICFIWLFAYNS